MLDLFRSKKSVKEVMEILDYLAQREQSWIIRFGKTFTPPLELPK